MCLLMSPNHCQILTNFEESHSFAYLTCFGDRPGCCWRHLLHGVARSTHLACIAASPVALSAGFERRTQLKFFTAARSLRVIGVTLIIRVKEAFKPLYELKVVLKPAFHQLFDWHFLNKKESFKSYLLDIQFKLLFISVQTMVCTLTLKFQTYIPFL